MKLINYIFQDWSSNYNIKSRLILVFFRMCHLLATTNKVTFILGLPILISYRIIVEWILCVEIPFKTKIGKHLVLFHGQGLVINNETTIGDNCTLRQSTTIGNSRMMDNGKFNGSPIIGNNVEIGANSIILGPITIGDNVTIGAGSVIVKSIESNCTVVGNPARVISRKIIIPSINEKRTPASS